MSSEDFGRIQIEHAQKEAPFLSPQELEARIAAITSQIEMKKLYAEWWMIAANTGTTCLRNVTRGDGHKLTREELIEDAMNIALSHIRQIDDAIWIRDAYIKARKVR